MRPAALDCDYGLEPKVLFRLIRVFSGYPVPDAAKITFYRPDFFGAQMKELTHEAMRNPSAWSVGDRELLAAYVAKLNTCPFCVGAHTATASRAYQDRERVAAALAELEGCLPNPEAARDPGPGGPLLGTFELTTRLGSCDAPESRGS